MDCVLNESVKFSKHTSLRTHSPNITSADIR